MQLNSWIQSYLNRQSQLLASIDQAAVARMVQILINAHRAGRQILVFGNGGSASNCSHFVTDLGKSGSDALGRRFKVLSLNDNVSWLTALGNDYAYEDVFVRQLENYGESGDVVLSLSVSGNSPNCVKALQWAKDHGLTTLALVGGKRGAMAEIADEVMVLEDTHYGRVEDMQMTICHLLCYAFIEKTSAQEEAARAAQPA